MTGIDVYQMAAPNGERFFAAMQLAAWLNLTGEAEDIPSVPVTKSADFAGDCEIWQGCVNGEGYGLLNVNGKTNRAHRVAMQVLGLPEILRNACVLHRCDTPSCVRRDHLFLGTQVDNVRDRDSKGRANPPRGENHSRSKLTEGNVREIRSRTVAGVRAMALEFGVSPRAIRKVLSGESWAHIQ